MSEGCSAPPLDDWTTHGPGTENDGFGEGGAAVDILAEFAVGLTYEALPNDVRERLSLLLTDLFGVTIAGHRTPELESLLAHWRPESGDAPLFGTDRGTHSETAAMLNAVAACCLELDEGNKHARGHPAVHVVFAALAAAQTVGRPVTGREFLVAVAGGYEVSARFGAALTRDERWHTHGHWGATGAACAAALIYRLPAAQTAAAIDSSAGLMHVTPWAMVLDGNFTRNFWPGGANVAGLNAARLAGSGLTRNTNAVDSTLGELVGHLDVPALTQGLGERWLLTQGYSKIHSSCSYTHAVVDAVQTLRSRHRFRAEEIASVCVRTHSLARPLLSRRVDNRLSGMFSLPFVTATAVLHDAVDPQSMDPATGRFEESRRFMDRVSIAIDPELDEHLPGERWADVRIRLFDGQEFQYAQPNPVGDIDYYPLDRHQTYAKIARLVGGRTAAQVNETVEALPTAQDVGETVRTMR